MRCQHVLACFWPGAASNHDHPPRRRGRPPRRIIGHRSSPPSMSNSTHRLLAAAQAGDLQARDALFARLSPRVFKIAALRMGCRESDLWDSEDLAQETLTDALLSLGSFVPRHEGALIHWLATLVQNNLTDHQRRRKSAKRGAGWTPYESKSSTILTDSVFGVQTVTPQDCALAAEQEQHLHEALLRLDEPKRFVIIQRKLCGLSFEEIAAEMGFSSPSSASALLSRALAELAESLK